MAGDKEFSIILKAADLSSQTIQQVVASLNKLTAAQIANNESAAKGSITSKDFETTLANLLKVVKAITDQQTSLQRFTDLQKSYEKAVEAVAAAELRRVAAVAALPDEESRTAKQVNALAKVEKALDSTQKKADTAKQSVAAYQSQLDKIGVQPETDRQSVTLQRQQESALNAVAAARDKLNAKIAAAPPEEERTKAQAYAISRLEKALLNAQSRAEEARVSFERYSNVKMNEAVLREQERLSEILTGIVPVIARANQETVTLADNRAKATEAANAQAAAEKSLADQLRLQAEAESRSDEEFAARNRAERQAQQAQFGTPNKIGQLQGGEVDKSTIAAEAANQLSLRKVRQEAFEEALRQNDAEVAAARTAAESIQAENKRAVEAAREASREAGELARQSAAHDKASADTAVALARYVENEKRREAKATADAIETLRQNTARADKDQADRLEALRTAQGKIADAQAELTPTQPLGVSATPSQGFLSLSSALSGIINPAQEARQTLAGLEAEIKSLGELLAGAKKRTEDYQAGTRQLALSFAALQQQSLLVDTYRANEAAAKRFGDALDQEKSKLGVMVELYNRMNTADREAEARIQSQISKVEAATRAYNAFNEKLAVSAAALKTAGIDTGDLEGAFERITTAGTRARATFEGLEKASGKGAGSGAIFLGLRPYELQNLSYQINDVFTQLASGTSLSQTAAQQGGQIFQLFERDIGAAYTKLKLIPFGLTAVGVAAAAATVGIFAFIRAIDLASEKRAFAAELKQNVDGARYSIDGLTDAAKGLEVLGVSLSDAAKGARDLVAAGASPDKIRPLLQLAANFANANNLKFPEALKQVQAAFTGTGQDLLKWATQLNNLLTSDQFKRIDDLVKSGDILAARAEAFDAVFNNIKEAGEKNTTPILAAFRKLKEAWTDLLDSLANNRAINLFGSALVAWLTTATNLTRDIFRFLDAVTHLDFENMRRAFLGLPSIKQEATVQARPPQPGGDQVKIGDGGDAVGMFQLHKPAAQDAGIQPEERFDYFKNIHAGLEYFRQQVVAFGGDIDSATRAFNRGAGGARAGEGGQYLADVKGQSVEKVDPKVAQDIFTEFSRVFASYAKQADIPKLLDRAMQIALQESGAQHFVPGARAPGEQAPEPSKVTSSTAADGQATNAQRIATLRFSEAQQTTLDSQRKAFADEDQLYAILIRDRQRAREKVAAEAAQTAAEGHTAIIDEAELRKQQDAAVDVVNKQYHEAWLGRLREREQFANTVRERELAADKTNLGAQIELVNRRYDAERTQADQLYAKGNFGLPVNQIHDDIEKARQDAINRTTVEVAKATIDAVTEERNKRLQIIQSQIPNAKPDEAAKLYAEEARIVSEFTPKINDALRKSDAALSKVPESDATRAQRAQNDLVRQQATRPEIIRSGEQQATTATTADLQAALKQRAADLALVADQVKVGGTAFSTALEGIITLSQRTVPQIRQLVQTTNDGLRQIAANPLTTPAERAALETQMKENLLAPAKAAVDTQNAVMAALQDDKQKLDKLIEEYHQAVIDLDKKIRDARLSPIQAAAERAKLDADFIPRIAAAGKTVQDDVTQARQAAGKLGLSPGFQQELSAFGQKAATESNPGTLNSDSLKQQGKQQLDLARQSQQSVAEVQKTQQELVKLGEISQTTADENIKQAFADANVEIAKLAPAIQDTIEQMTKLGNTAGARKLADDFKLLQAQMKYVDPLTQQIVTTLENSFVSRGVQAFDTIAQSIGNVIANGGKLKDIWVGVGQAFSQFTAGILRDIAAQIIKFYLLRAVSSLFPGLSGILGGTAGAAAGAVGGAVNAAGQSAGEVALVSAAGAVAHSGGIIGESGMSRVVDLSLFREARRMHAGGTVGLAADEVPAILQRGEHVLTKAQAERTQQQKVTSGDSGTAIRNVLAVGDKEIASAMNSSHGEKVVMNILRRNSPTIKQWVG